MMKASTVGCGLSRILPICLLLWGSVQGISQGANRPMPTPPGGNLERTGPGRPLTDPGPEKVVSMTTYSHFCTEQKVLCQESFAHAMVDVRQFFSQDPTKRYRLTIPAGTFDFSDETTPLPRTDSAIDVSGIRPTTGLFIIAGAGSARTTLITANQTGQIRGVGVSHIHIQGITFRRHSMTTTQGPVVEASPGVLKIQIPPGFPLVTEIYVKESGNGHYLRVYDNTNRLEPHLNLDPSNTQVPFGNVRAPECSGRVCTIFLDHANEKLPAIYTQPHQVVGVKTSLGGSAYNFNNVAEGRAGQGVDVGFSDVVWYDNGRGIWRNFKDAFVTNGAVRKRPPVGGQAQVMSTSNGGPQFGYPDEQLPMGGGNVVENFTADATGDDSIAIFNDMTNTSIFRNTMITDAFARTINLYKSCHVKLENNVGKFCSPQFDFPKQYHGCVTDTSHPGPTPCGPDL